MKTDSDFWPHIDAACANWLNAGGLRPLNLCERTLLPIVQGGMGIGVSAHRLAGSVAALGGGRHHFLGRPAPPPPGPDGAHPGPGAR